MKKYILALAVTLGLLAPSASLYAQEAPAAPVAELDAGTAVAGSPEAPATPGEAAASEPAPAEENGAPVEASGEPSEAEADPAEEAAKDPLGTAGKVKEAVQSGEWGLAVLLSLMLIVSFLRWGSSKFEFLGFFEGKLGGYILVFTTSAGGMLLTVLGAGGSLTFTTISQAAVLGFGAIGGWETVKDIKNRKKKAEA